MIVLDCNLPEHGLAVGDIGVVVHCYNNGEAIEAEFNSGQGQTIAVVTLSKSEFRPMEKMEILHARKIAA